MDLKKIAAQSFSLEGIGENEIYSALGYPPDDNLGDLALPCFKFSKILRKSPAHIAEQVAKCVVPSQFIARAEALNGYVNFFFNRDALANEVLNELNDAGDAVFYDDSGLGKTICIDYCSINIAKPFHIGHLVTASIGGSLARLYKKLGYNVVSINHLGDWGTQFGMMIAAYLRWGNDQEIKERGVYYLADIYARFNNEAENDPALLEEGRAWFKRIEDGEEQATRIFNRFREITFANTSKVCERLGITFDSYNGESFYNDKMDEIVQILEKRGILKESEGAKVVDLSDYSMPPCLILKKDGASLYATRDLAAALYRKRTYDFDKCLYVVAYHQNLHFAQFFKVLELMGFDWAKDCKHIAYGMVSLPEGSLSTRKGRVIHLEDVLDAASAKTGELMRSKNPDWSENELAETAEKVGTGAVIFSALSQSRIKDVVFSLNDVLNFEGETGPYLMYTHSRCASVLQNASLSPKIEGALVTTNEEFKLIKSLNRFKDIICDSVAKNEPSILSRYLIDTAQAFNKFYFEHKILCDDLGISAARLALTKITKAVLAEGMRLLLLHAPNKM